MGVLGGNLLKDALWVCFELRSLELKYNATYLFRSTLSRSFGIRGKVGGSQPMKAVSNASSSDIDSDS